ncbi:MAG: PduL/EutD family phosphate acyltransferase [bacterium]|nr:PduL/EutD family phosphate acyltransferase [bacterium]
MRVRLEISAHHCHVTNEDVAILFGRGYHLRPRREISQPGQYAAAENVRIRIGTGEITARIVGPERPHTQVEIPKTLAVHLGVNPPVTYFGSSSAPRVQCELIGPKGRVRRRAVIVAHRHIHCNPVDARRIGLRNRQTVSVRTHGTRPLTFHDVVVRVHPKFKLACHLDTDEANAAGIRAGEWGTIVAGK